MKSSSSLISTSVFFENGHTNCLHRSFMRPVLDKAHTSTLNANHRVEKTIRQFSTPAAQTQSTACCCGHDIQFVLLFFPVKTQTCLSQKGSPLVRKSAKSKLQVAPPRLSKLFLIKAGYKTRLSSVEVLGVSPRSRG
jgi:hypothetical protein